MKAGGIAKDVGCSDYVLGLDRFTETGTLWRTLQAMLNDLPALRCALIRRMQDYAPRARENLRALM